MKRFTILVTCVQLFAVSTLLAQQKPNLSGRWQLEKGKSEFGRMPAPSSVEDVIEHKDPTLVITSTQTDQRGETKTFLKLTTDGKENLNDINGNQFRSTSRW